MRPHPCSPSAPEAVEGGWYTFSTEDSQTHPGSGNWAPTTYVSSCAGPTRYRLAVSKGERPAWQITRGKRSQDHRQIWDLHRRQYRKTGIVAVPVRHPKVELELWLVVSRPGKGRTAWYLLPSEPVESPDDAWRVVLAYARRWQVEVCYRTCKTDLAMESPRLWFWENRLKLLLMVSLVYALLLSLLTPNLAPQVQELLRNWCLRTGERYRQAAIPLSRLRAALSALWLPHPPIQKFGMTHVSSSCWVAGRRMGNSNGGPSGRLSLS